MTATLPISATRPLRIVFRPMGSVTETLPTCAQVTQLANGSMRYLEAIYPVDERSVSTVVECVPAFFSGDDLMESYVSDGKTEYTVRDAVFNRLAQDRWGAAADKVVGVVKPGWFDDHHMAHVLGLAPIDGFSAIVDVSSTWGVPAPHELAHNYGLVPATLPGNDGSYHYRPGTPAAGYWVARDQVREGNNDFMVPGLSSAGGSPGGTHWISSGAFNYLLGKLAMGAPAGPARPAGVSDGPVPVIEVQGTITRTGGAALGPWYRENGMADLPLDAPGAYRLEYRDATGNLLGQTGFDLSFAAPPDSGAPGQLDTAAFAFRIPDLPDTQRIVLRQGSTTLGERLFSAQPPSVTVTYPSGGEVLLTGQTVAATWTASDADGDPLRYRVALSPDNGATWLSLASDLSSPQYAFQVPENILSEQILLKVTASDGVNTAADTSDAPFSMRRTAETAGCFAPAVNVSQSAGESTNPQMAVSGSHVYMVYDDSTPDKPGGAQTSKIYFRASHDGGQTWDPPLKLYQGSSVTTYYPKVAAAGSHVYVAWGYTYGGVPLTLAVSHDYGQTFGAPVTLTSDMKAGRPTLYASGNDLYAWWVTGWGPVTTYLSISHDAGATFQPLVTVVDPVQNYGVMKLAFSGANVYALYSDAGRSYALYYRHSTDGGATFSPPLEIDPGISNFGDANLAFAGTNVYLAVHRDTLMSPGIYYQYVRTSTDGGANFGPEVVVEQSSLQTRYATLAASGQTVYLTWMKWENISAPETDLWYAVSHDGGGTWSFPARISGTGKRSEQHALLATGNQVWLAWYEMDAQTRSSGTLLVRASTDLGDSFFAARKAGPAGAGRAENPQLAQLGNTVLLAWDEAPPASYADVMLARSTACVAAPPPGVSPVPVPPVLGALNVPATIPEGAAPSSPSPLPTPTSTPSPSAAGTCRPSPTSTIAATAPPA
jgi:hypothetical protein